MCEDNEFCTSYPQGDDAMDYDQYSNSPYCAPYASEGVSCGWTSTMFQECAHPLSCYISSRRDRYYDLIGVCWMHGDYYDDDNGYHYKDPCKDASDCESPTEEWCETDYGLCRPRFFEKMGCEPNVEKQCQDGLECKNQAGWWHCVKAKN